jgi:hypothetical protein
VVLYAVPSTPFDNELEMILRLVGAAETVMLNAWEAA